VGYKPCSYHLGVKGSQVQILSSRQKALVGGNFHQGFVVSEGGHCLVHSFELLGPSTAEVDQSRSALLPAKCTKRCPSSGPESAQGDAPTPSGEVGAGVWVSRVRLCGRTI